MPTLLHTADAVGGGPAVKLRSDRSRDEVLVQVHITGSATVEILGRASQRLPFVLLQTVSTSGLVAVARVAEIQARVASISSGVVDVEAHIDV